jgi:hypothetical protein
LPCGLDRNNIKADIDNVLSKHVMVAHFPISNNYYDMFDGSECVYTHMTVITSFGFREVIPYFNL